MSSAVIIAYDGHVVDSLELRAMAVHDALHAEKIDIAHVHVRACVAGRSLAEAVHAVAHQFAPNADPTSLDIAALRADRVFSATAARGLALQVGAIEFIRQSASHARVFLRADSRRSDVAHVLEMTQLEPLIAFVRCADDGGLRATNITDRTLRTLNAAYAQIAVRVESRTIQPNACTVYESSQDARNIASANGYSLALTVG